MRYATLVLALAMCACQSTGKSGKPAEVDMEKVMAEMAAAAAPAPQHAHLTRLVGYWDGEVRVKMDPDSDWLESTSTSEYSAELEGRYILQNYSSTFMGEPYGGRQIFGYDKLKKRYFAVWFGQTATWPVFSYGQADETGKIVFVGEMVDVLTPDGRPTRMTLDIIDDDHVVFEMFDTIEDREVKVMEIRSVRRG